MTAQPDLKRKYTVEEYIELLKNSEERFEYFDGEIFSMAAIIGLESAVRLETLGVELPLSEIYRMIRFPEETETIEPDERTA